MASPEQQRVARVAKELESSSRGRLTAVGTEKEGIRVVSSTDISPKGTLLLECPAIRIALDPSRWATHCGFCASSMEANDDDDSSRSGRVCPSCQVVGFCATCSSHEETTPRHTQECIPLQNFLTLLQADNNDREEDESSNDGEPPSLMSMDVTSHLLTIRLLCAVNDDTTIIAKNDDDKTQGWWNLLPHLYASPIPFNEIHNSQSIVSACWNKQRSVKKKSPEEDHHQQDVLSTTLAKNDNPMNDNYETILGRVLGCSHAVTDLSLPLGTQTLGRALFWHHSFYNHACAPNAFLSCDCTSSSTMTTTTATKIMANMTANMVLPTVIARVHLLQSVSRPGEPITLSYIPLSGLSRQERKERLQASYGFSCDCPTCCRRTSSASSIKDIDLPENANVDSIREIQYSCNERLLLLAAAAAAAAASSSEEHDDGDEEEVESILALVRMTQRGMRNQGIPLTHEVSLEAHRLLAMGCSLQGEYEEAIRHHREWLQHVVEDLMDPTAMATQRLALARDIVGSASTSTRNGEKLSSNARDEWQTAMDELVVALGENNPWVQTLLVQRKNSVEGDPTGHESASKRQRLEDE